ncbi:MAG TPA: Na(+)-translocating NADH-quinone reductase subunit C [Candidatus Hydrogenedentes bacterium]|nr:Na(+)-translocating NADH-quinone reductase subunit C [Candidatus Hydrogenedentota bacterium]
MRREGTLYTILFTCGVCGICSVLVSGAAVGLKERQIANRILERQTHVLAVTGMIDRGAHPTASQIREIFQDRVVAKVIDLATGEFDDSADVATFDQRRAAKDPATSTPAPENDARVLRLPKNALVYLIREKGSRDEIEQIVLPVEGMGLWSILYGYLALDKDTTTIRGITFYEHGETPGLGGEVENPTWTAKWPGRKAFDNAWQPAVRVVKGVAGGPEEDPHHVDGLSGATLTSRGVTNLLAFWLGDNGFGPFLGKIREQQGS